MGSSAGHDGTFTDLSEPDVIALPNKKLYNALTGGELLDEEPLKDALLSRILKLKNPTDPYPKPSEASRKQVQSGSVKPHGDSASSIPVLEDTVDAVWAISSALNLDEIDAYITLRLFIRDQGLSFDSSSTDKISHIPSLVEAITEFYFDERLYILRIIGALLQIKANQAHKFHTLATEVLSKIVADEQSFATTTLRAFKERTTSPVRIATSEDGKKKADTRTVASWAKQNLKEQLCILEVIFWACYPLNNDAAFVLDYLTVAYETDLGSVQKYKDFLLNEECTRIRLDIEALIVFTVPNLLKVDKFLAEPLDMDLITYSRHGYLASPADVERIHDLVYSSTPSSPRYSLILLSWGYVLNKLTEATKSDDIPQDWQQFAKLLNPPPPPHHSYYPPPTPNDQEMSIADQCIKAALDQGFLSTLRSYLSEPILSLSASNMVGSMLTDPGSGTYKYTAKCLFFCLTHCVRVEFIGDFDCLVDVWIGVFGKGERAAVETLSAEFWGVDIHIPDRSALLEIALSRFPVEVGSLVRIIRSLSGIGGLDLLENVDDEDDGTGAREYCGKEVFAFFSRLPRFTQILQPHHMNGPQPLYATQPDAAMGMRFVTTRAIGLPGGSVLPKGSIGRVLSSQGVVAVQWNHIHSGWELLLAILTEHQRKKHTSSAASHLKARSGRPVQLPDDQSQPVVLGLEDIGLEIDVNDQELMADILDLFRSVLHRNLELTGVLVEGLEHHHSNPNTPPISPSPTHPNFSSDSAPPDLVQVIFLILKDALSSPSLSRGPPPTRIVTSALGVLTALLPVVPRLVWPFLRSLPQLFGDERQMGSTPLLLNAERAIGSYPMTFALLDLVGALFDEAFRMVLTHNRSMQHMKTDVLVRALTFVHSEIWSEHSGWKYAKLSDRFQIGRKLSMLYGEILKLSPPLLPEKEPNAAVEGTSTLAVLTHFVLDTFLWRATSSTINPLVSSIATGRELTQALYHAMRANDGAQCHALLDANLRLVRLILVRKRTSGATKLSLLEQTLFTGVSASNFSTFGTRRLRTEPIEAITTLIVSQEQAAVEAVQLLSAFCSSVSLCQPSPPSIVGHLRDAEATAKLFVNVALDPWEDNELRKAIWDFISVSVDSQPAFASLFVGGQLHSTKSKQKAITGGKAMKQEKEKAQGAGVESGVEGSRTALDAVSDFIESGFWEVSPDMLAASLGLLDLVWQHALEHLEALKSKRNDPKFWKQIASIATKDLPAIDSVEIGDVVTEHGETHSILNDPVSQLAYRTKAKAHALHILALDLKITSPSGPLSSTSDKPSSFSAVSHLFKSQALLSQHVQEALRCSYNPEVHRTLQTAIQTYFPTFTLDSVRSLSLPMQRPFGDRYLFNSDVLHNRLMKYAGINDELCVQATEAFKGVCAVNLDWSLIDSQVALTRSWKKLLQEMAPWLRTQTGVESNVMHCAAEITSFIADERRGGEIMASVHAERLAVLQGLFEVAWLAAQRDVIPPAEEFMPLLKNVRLIVLSDNFPPLQSLRRRTQSQFHRTLLYSIYFCARRARLFAGSATAKLEHRLLVSAQMHDILGFVVDGLRTVFDLAHGTADDDLDQDMQLLVAVFQQCTRSELHSTPSMWLARCQEVDLLRASLELFVRTDLSGRQQDGSSPRKQPLYGQHILQFHVTLASLQASAERVAHEGVMNAYCKNDLTSLLEVGAVDPVLPDQPGDRSSAHRSWCTILGVTSALIEVLSGDSASARGHFIEIEVLGFVQLYGSQLTRVLGWDVGDTLSLPLLEEMRRVVKLFHAIAVASCTPNVEPDTAIADILQAFSERALVLLQRINYATAHPNQLATMLEPITPDERHQMEKEEQALSVETTIQLIDPARRPLLASVVQSLLVLSRDIVATLLIISKADSTIGTSIPSPGSMRYTLLVPQAKVSAQEPASAGTLLELATFMLDVFRHVLKDASSQTATVNSTIGTYSLQPYDPKFTQSIALQAIEVTCLYAVAQLATAVHRSIPDLIPGGPSAANTGTGFGGDMFVDTDGDRRQQVSAPGGILVDTRTIREWRDLAIDFNIIAKNAKATEEGRFKGSSDKTSAIVLFDVITRFTVGMMDKLEKRLRRS